MKLIEKLNDIYSELEQTDGLFSFECGQTPSVHFLNVSIINIRYHTQRVLNEILRFLYANYNNYSVKGMSDERMSGEDVRRRVTLRVEIKR